MGRAAVQPPDEPLNRPRKCLDGPRSLSLSPPWGESDEVFRADSAFNWPGNQFLARRRRTRSKARTRRRQQLTFK
ncbi:hypothetical protein chiPu_0021966 [Chiloscyllium punctatum]|uniref:Uncharacterized protein n=1 Tax=Chiloscyllium punctatum TaxID=137246 RepID=A0A401RG96_CHIPU|nr:hypothetical protein [Chiloscyllium punctatum]